MDNSLQLIDPESVRKVRLNSGVAMPVAAFGTFHSDWAQEYMYQATLEAIRLGWRHLDTARAYENEALIGAAIKQSMRLGYISSVEDLFITGKLWNGHMNPKDVLPALEGTLTALGIDQIDMYLNHWPWPNAHIHGAGTEFRSSDAVPYIHEEFMETWEELCKAKRAGKIVDIGTSNHTAACMNLLLRDVGITERPSCNQMEMHPLMQQTALRREFESENILCTGYMSLGSPNRPARDRFDEHLSDLDNATLCDLASELGV
jgi:diketogulonate reductase-like aldo/keto reductase